MYAETAEDLKWKRRNDARTLAEAERIKADKERYKGAIIGAKEIAKEELERVRGIAKVAGTKVPKSKADTYTKPEPFVTRRGGSNQATIGRL